MPHCLSCWLSLACAVSLFTLELYEMASNPYAVDLDRNPANHQQLTPLTFLDRSAQIHPDHCAIIHGETRINYREFYARSRRLASVLAKNGIGKGDTVSAMLANTPPMLDAHYGVPMTGAVLHAINTRLDAKIIAFQLDHAETKVLVTDREFSPTIKAALELCEVKPLVIDYDDKEFPQDGEMLGDAEYEAWIASGEADFAWSPPVDEWDAISLNYTSGTTGNPKGVVYPPSRGLSDGLWQRAQRWAWTAPRLSLDAADVSLQWLVLSLGHFVGCWNACLLALGAAEIHLRRLSRPQSDPSLRSTSCHGNHSWRQR